MEGPGTSLPGVPGTEPKTRTSPLVKRTWPAMAFMIVVFPHPEAPRSPYLEQIKMKLKK